MYFTASDIKSIIRVPHYGPESRKFFKKGPSSSFHDTNPPLNTTRMDMCFIQIFYIIHHIIIYSFIIIFNIKIIFQIFHEYTHVNLLTQYFLMYYSCSVLNDTFIWYSTLSLLPLFHFHIQ